MFDVAKCGLTVTLDTKTCFDVNAGIGVAPVFSILFTLLKPVEGSLGHPSRTARDLRDMPEGHELDGANSARRRRSIDA